MKGTNHKPKELPAILTNLIKSGVRAERIAFELDVSYGTIRSWCAGTRKPKQATIQQIEHLYGVRIL